MIVEIHGIEDGKMNKIEKTLRLLGLKDTDKFKEKIVMSADSGEARRAKTHRLVLEGDGVLVFLREPGELCLTINGSPMWTFYILGILDAKYDIPAGPVAEIYEKAMQSIHDNRGNL